MAALLGARFIPAATRAPSLDRHMQGAEGTAVLVDIRERRLIAAHRPDLAAASLAPPGSTLKPFVLEALLRLNKLGPEESYFCPGSVTISGEPFNCSHTPAASPFRVRTALAYSCNCFVAHFAERFGPGELAAAYQRAGLATVTGILGPDEAAGRIQPAPNRAAIQLQALGEDRVMITLAELVMAYRSLALRAERPEVQAILEGLEDAVKFGTAQNAQVAGVTVAGKTGTVQRAGFRLAWFAGFAPSRTPRVAVAVMLQGRSGGADAAPVAGRILSAWHEGRL